MTSPGADAPPTSAARRGAGRFGVTATIVLVLAVIGSEFLLLRAVYLRPDSVQRQQVVAAGLAGRLSGPVSAVDLAAARGDLDALAGAGASAIDVAATRAALDAAASRPPGTALTGVRDAAASLNRRLADQRDAIDLQAQLIYVALLIAASVGWMAWFRRLVAKHKDLQRRVTEQEATAASEHRLAALVHNSSDAILVLGADTTVNFATPSADTVFGRPADAMLGRRLVDGVVHPEDLPAFLHFVTGERTAESAVAFRVLTADGRAPYLEGTVTNLLLDPAVDGLVLTVRDVTARRELEERLTHHAFHDSLTGLANRRLFADRLQHAMRRGARDGARPTVVFFDLDDFKQINDSVGHGTGDQVLSEVSKRLSRLLRSTDTAARLGGDEFAVLIEEGTLVEAHELAERLLVSLAVPLELEGYTHHLAASVGLAQADDDALTWDDVLRNADVAMYLAKSRGKSGIAVYEAELHAESLERMQLRADLQRALRTGDEFVLHYQPAVDLKSGGIVGFEALVRWMRPGHGLVSPLAFVPEAERCGLIVPLGSWVLRRACEAAASMQTAAHRPTMSVNVAAAQLSRDDFVEEVLTVVEECGLAPDRLCLEITETTLLRDLAKVIEQLTTLRSHGIRVAVDDFGTGYSSLSYLSKLPVDVLKVDKSFVDRVTLDEQDATVTHAILAMSSAMHLTTVAEGIEESGQATWLASANCAIGQGFLWSRPVPIDDAFTLLDVVQDSIAWARPGDVPPLRVVEDLPHGHSPAALHLSAAVAPDPARATG